MSADARRQLDKSGALETYLTPSVPEPKSDKLELYLICKEKTSLIFYLIWCMSDLVLVVPTLAESDAIHLHLMLLLTLEVSAAVSAAVCMRRVSCPELAPDNNSIRNTVGMPNTISVGYHIG
ncbi:hypothetical protein K438DRAFT_528679 [Mycena galopus ATCC 62051]|nr:hypothetical protein K438DRAFT_528679 [Mycena galopus ATCC 62051]